MNLQTFKSTLANPRPPENLSLALEALWWDAKGNWEKAHECAQARDDDRGMRVHAYLHRREGDLSNAAYWYRRCGAKPVSDSLEDEWVELVQTFLREN